MTVAALPSTISYIEDGSTVAFAAPFRFKAPQHLIATRYFADGSDQVLTYGTDYTATGGTTDAGGTLTVTAAAVSGTRLAIQRRTPRSQSMSYTTNDRFPAKSHEGALDNEMLIAQEDGDAITDHETRGVFAPIGEDGYLLPTRADGAGKLIGFDDDPGARRLKAYALSATALESLASIAPAIATVAANITQLQAVYLDLGNIDDVADDLISIVAIAGSLTNLNALAGDLTNINNVAANLTTINNVAANITTIAAVGGSIANVNAVATDMALGAGASFILRAPQAAIDAVAAIATVTALIAAIPTGAGVRLEGAGIPANNLGSPAAIYYDTTTAITYTKVGTAWSLGAVTDVNAGWIHYDLSLNATYPTALLPITRANPATALATNLCYHDAPGTAYQTFSAGQPIRRNDLGAAFMPQSRNVFLNSTAPADQTAIAVPVGKIIIWSHHDAGVTVTSAANGAVGSGFNPVTSGVPQVLTITTAGNISVTHSGAGTWYVCQVEYNPNVSFTNNSCATPLIITAGAPVTRDWDDGIAASDLLNALKASSGTFLLELSRIETQTGFGRTLGVVGLNGSTSIGINAAAAIGFRGFNVSAPMANWAWNTGTGSSQKFAFAWSGATASFGAGDGLPVIDTVAFNGGVAVTSAAIGGRGNGSGQQVFGGWVKRIKWRAAADRLSERALFDQYTATIIPTVAISGSKLIRVSMPGNSLPNTKTGVAAVKANTRDSIHIFKGTSHSAGVQPGSSPSANSMPAKYAARLSVQYGIPARYAGWFGNNNSAPGAGASIYRPDRLTFSAGFINYGVQLGGASIKTSTNGAVITDVVPGISDTYGFYYWTFPGYGNWTLADGNGHSKTVPAATAYTASAAAGVMTVSGMPAGAYIALGDVLTGGTMPAGTTVTGFGTGTGGNGTYTISSTATVTSATINSIGLRLVSLMPADGVVRGSNTFTMTSNDSLPKTACGGLERDSLVKSVLVINGGTSLRTAVTLATDAVNSGAAENSVMAVERALAADLTHFEAVTNDASTGTPETIYFTAVMASIAQGLVFGDVVVSGDPPTAPGTIPQATQDRYTWLEYRAAYNYGVPIIALPDVLGPRLKWANMGLYSSDTTHGTGNTTVSFNGDIWGNMVADFVGANV
jgi:hypothetical protein